MKLSVVSLCFSGILVKYHYETNPAVTVNDMTFVRAFAQLVVSYFIAVREKVDLLDVPPEAWKLVIIRAILGTMTFFVFNLAVKLVSLSKLAFLNNVSPIFAVCLAFLFLGEQVSREELISLCICMIGVAILVQPYGESS